jgi:hypothetical protein
MGAIAVDPDEFRLWDIWQVDWTHEDCLIYEATEHPAICISTADDVRDESRVRFVKVSSTDPHPRMKLSIKQGDAGFTHTGLKHDCFIHVSCEQHYPPTNPPILRRLGSLPMMTTHWLSMLRKECIRRARYEIKKSPKW